MGIREILAEQDAEFVSLRSLIEQLAAADGSSIKDVATYLHRLFEISSDAPEWYSRTGPDPMQWMTPKAARNAANALRYVALHGTFGEQWSDVDDDIPF